MAAIIDEAKRQGTAKQLIDSEEIAWMLVGCARAEDTAYLMNIELFQEKTLALRMADLILGQIVIPNPRGCQSAEVYAS
jgi:hypothetical protein